jgi:hypothetical protein
MGQGENGSRSMLRLRLNFEVPAQREQSVADAQQSLPAIFLKVWIFGDEADAII